MKCAPSSWWMTGEIRVAPRHFIASGDKVSTKQPSSSKALPWVPLLRGVTGIAAEAASSAALASLYVALRRLWVPSQNGGERVCLQPHRTTSPLVLAVKRIGRNVDPTWDPSQNGWIALRPQAHHR